MPSRYQKHLDRVSRSFAFCIKELPQPEQDWVGLSYLLCRLADTIEDHSWASFEAQFLAFDRFISFIKTAPQDEPVQNWIQGFPQSLTPGERELVAASSTLISDFHALPHRVKEIIESAVLSMSRGMMAFQEQYSFHKSFRIQSLAQLDQYCFFVAGLVGELLTKLMAEAQPSFKPTVATYRQAIHFGLFLQKINILKDWTDDAREGRVFADKPESLLPSVAHHAGEAMAYLEAIPSELGPYRRFCTWSFFMGMASLPYSIKSWSVGHPIKLPRVKAMLLIEKVARISGDHSKLRALYRELSEDLPKTMPQLSQTKSVASRPSSLGSLRNQHLSELYQGELDFDDLCSVGLVTK